MPQAKYRSCSYTSFHTLISLRNFVYRTEVRCSSRKNFVNGQLVNGSSEAKWPFFFATYKINQSRSSLQILKNI